MLTLDELDAVLEGDTWLESRAQGVVGRYAQAQEGLQRAQERAEALRGKLRDTEDAKALLAAFGASRRVQVRARLSASLTTAVRQTFGPEYAVTVGDESASGNAADAAVLVFDGRHTGEVRLSQGFALRNIVAFALWLSLFHLLRNLDPGLSGLVLFDEPFLNLDRERMVDAAALLAGVQAAGVRLLLITNHPELIPEDASVVRLRRVPVE